MPGLRDEALDQDPSRDAIHEVFEHFETVSSIYYDMVDSYKAGLSYYHQREMESALRWIAKHQPGRILDAGCGPGRLTVRLAANGREVVSLDLSQKMLSELRHRSSKAQVARALAPVQGDVRALPFEAESFDFVVCAEVLEHLPDFPADCGSMFAEMARVLRPGGHFVLEFPLFAHSLLRRLPGSTVPWREIARPEWAEVATVPLRFQRRFRPREIERMLRTIGFDVVERRFVRVLPSGFSYRVPSLDNVDVILEKSPVAQSFAREMILLLRKRRPIGELRAGLPIHERKNGIRPQIRRIISYAAYTGVVPPPTALRPPGISAMTMAKNEEEWAETSAVSILPFVDELLIADHGSEDRTPSILQSLAESYPDKIRLISVGDLDFPSAVNLMISRTRFRWILRWHADFVARSSGPFSIAKLVERTRKLDPNRHFCIALSGIALDGDLEHQYADRRDRPEPFLYTCSPWLRYTVRARWESLITPWFYEKQEWPEACYFHMRSVKSSLRMMQKLYWSRWFDARNRGATISLRDFATANAIRDWGGSTLEEAARNYILIEFQGCVPYSKALCGEYPDLLVPALQDPPFKLVFKDGKLVDRIEEGRYRPQSWQGA